jgi:hypothetical protein
VEDYKKIAITEPFHLTLECSMYEKSVIYPRPSIDKPIWSRPSRTNDPPGVYYTQPSMGGDK